MRRGLVYLTGFVRVLHLAAPAQAQERPNGFYLTSPLSLSSGYDDNFLSGPPTLSGSVSVLTSPTFSWIADTHRAMFSVDYKAEFDIFSRDETLKRIVSSNRPPAVRSNGSTSTSITKPFAAWPVQLCEPTRTHCGTFSGGGRVFTTPMRSPNMLSPNRHCSTMCDSSPARNAS